ncbi:hypothetical protein MPSEU_000451100 [Mayamaea pseudoterrestris]|nr:hypothetical protein MPSEU_000451100 [Mayamaea pseudoterrestris]
MQTTLSTLLLVFGCIISLTVGWAPDGTIKTTRRYQHAAFRPSLPLYSVSIQDPNDMKNNDFDDSESPKLLPYDPLVKEQQKNLLSNIRWNDKKMLQNIVTGVVGATIVYQLLLHQQHHARGWDFSEIALRDFADTWASYMQHLQSNPILTKAITSGSVYTIGDLIAQRTEIGGSSDESPAEGFDGMRVLRSGLAGFIGHGTLSHFWYLACDYSFEHVLHLSAAFWPLKILIDQTVWGPIWNNTYILLLGLMKRESLETVWADMKRTTVPLIVSGLKLWPLAHCVTYGLIPTENRVLWVDMVEILWVTILATQAAGPAVEKD